MKNKEMELKKQIDTLLSKKMNRKDFLVRAGIAFLSVVGVFNLFNISSRNNAKQATFGYGSGPYGGSATSNLQAKQTTPAFGKAKRLY
jgi:hypothetical protein